MWTAVYSDRLRPEIAPCQCSGKCHLSVRPFSGKYTNVSFCTTITAPLIRYIGNGILQIERRVDKSGWKALTISTYNVLDNRYVKLSFFKIISVLK